MRNLKDAKTIYDSIVVPEELDSRLRKILNETPEPAKTTPRRLSYYSQWAAAVAAVLIISFTIGLNSSESFAKDMAEFPLLGSIAKVLTVRSYETTQDSSSTKVEIPEIILDNDDIDVQYAITDVNEKIQSVVNEFTLEKEAEIAAYKQDFLEAGGTEEEWLERSIEVTVNYSVMYQDDAKLSLLLDSWISWANFEEERHFYNIDLRTGELLTLTDLLGADAYEYASGCVLMQMQKNIEADPENVVYWGVNDTEDFDSEFIGVTPNTPFYISEDGKVVISYDKYEVAPGFMGIQEFEIPYE